MKSVVLKKPSSHHYDAKTWCLDNIGLDCSTFKHGHWYCNNIGTENGQRIVAYFFKNDDDATMFTLRWS